MEYSKEDLTEAKRQINSTLRKLREASPKSPWPNDASKPLNWQTP